MPVTVNTASSLQKTWCYLSWSQCWYVLQKLILSFLCLGARSSFLCARNLWYPMWSRMQCCTVLRNTFPTKLLFVSFIALAVGVNLSLENVDDLWIWVWWLAETDILCQSTKANLCLCWYFCHAVAYIKESNECSDIFCSSLPPWHPGMGHSVSKIARKVAST